MMRWMLVLMLLPMGAMAAKKKPAQPEAQGITLTASPIGITVGLKDGQRAKGRLLGYDAFYLVLEHENGRRYDVPWKEVSEFAPDEFSGDTAMVRQYLTQEEVVVTAVIQPKDLGRVTGKAFWPGFLVHGAGFREAGNNDMFLSLAGAEIFGALIAGFGASKVLDAGVAKGDKDTAQYLVWGGGAVFLGSWLVDLAFSRVSAGNYNARHGFSLGLAPQGAVLALRF